MVVPWHQFNSTLQLQTLMRVPCLFSSDELTYNSTALSQYSHIMFAPRMWHLSALTRHLHRSLPSSHFLRNRTARICLRPISILRDNHNFQLRTTIGSFFCSVRSTQPSITLQRLWPQQWRGMKTRSSVKRLCDGCKVSSIFQGLSQLWNDMLTGILYSLFGEKIEYILYGMHFIFG